MLERFSAVLWPAFLMAGVMSGVFFSLIDPQDLSFHGQPLELAPMAVYTIGFFVFWAFAAASSALTCVMHTTASPRTEHLPLHPREQ